MSGVISYGSVISLSPQKEITLFAYSDGFMRDSLHLKKINPSL